MKGVLLAGGMGTRLSPLTKITNKHLLPIYDKPMILYGIEMLRASGIIDIMLVCGREHAGHFMNFLGSGKDYGVNLSYALQDKNNGGIADALLYAEDFADDEPVAVLLGDNLFENNFKKEVKEFKGGATIFLKKVSDPERFGVPVFNKNKTKILTIEEKPKEPKSEYAQTGFYLFDKNVFSYMKKLAPSKRGELEIADTVNKYIPNKLHFAFLEGWWFDAGTFDSLLKAAEAIATSRKNHA
jgi:glucose-1-phosphate thymidylyltransferase